MRTTTRGTSRVLALALGAATSLTVLSGTASAADIDAPYARAAAKVAGNATLLGGKNVQSVTRGSGVGVYCIKVPSRAVSDLSTAAIVATLNNFRGEITAIGAPHSYCGNDANTITIVTSDSSGKGADRPFTVAVL
ncbi:hypothetical protein GCM10015535_59990 [Streptomyces gelaticus]|uniref:Uncharacterized protein n=1 Tax=Streptomyces gelaticus TaxID=285446 RepID=A0ABQ2W8Q9_9ACTN|nr:hypothetical protein [Streptomyces gelaticus]GGV94483.1 hypothetical protein GCM10015535_59990 [Streptomyces gelaticus]